MSDMGAKPASKYKPEETIIIKDGNVIPDDKDIYVTPRAVIKFSNEDAQSYTIVFMVHDQDPIFPWANHADVDLFLSAFGSATMVADRDIIIGQCKYLVEPTSVNSIGGGGDVEKSQAPDEDGVAPPKECTASGTGNASPIRPRVVRSKKSGGGGGGGTIHIGS
jgi:hypothetical protein